MHLQAKAEGEVPRCVTAVLPRSERLSIGPQLPNKMDSWHSSPCHGSSFLSFILDEPTWRCHQNPFVGALGIQEPVILGEPQVKGKPMTGSLIKDNWLVLGSLG
jgi:hypothetical protein